jgi:predicted phosphodiesterase
MRIAIVSDIHGNRRAFEAVLRDLQEVSPDLTFHGGDLAGPGSSPAEIVDRIRDLGWTGVLGNTDEMLFKPSALDEFASQSPELTPLWNIVREMAAATRDALGDARLAWLQNLPQIQIRDELALVHASPASLWRAPGPEDGDAELESVYGGLRKPMVVYGHIHRPFVRRISQVAIANSGSAGLPYDGDRRAAYLLIDVVRRTVG